MKRLFLSLLILFLIAGTLLAPPVLPRRIGRSDFHAYWSASYLLARSQNFSDPDLVFAVEREQTGRTEDYPMMTWNPPWLLALLVPYALVPFHYAVWWWLLTSIALLSVGGFLLWHLNHREESHHVVLLAPLFVFAFSPSLVALMAGQVVVLVFFGLALFLFLWQRNSFLYAGMALALVMIKPHLVYLTLPLILLKVVALRRWHVLAGFLGTLVALSSVVLLLRPASLGDYVQNMGGNERLLAWHTPTLGGALQLLTGQPWGKFIGLLLLPLAFLVWWRYLRHLNMQTLVALSLLLSVATAPFGWSYDFIILLIPIMHSLVLLRQGAFSPLQTAGLVTALIAIDAVSFYVRLIAPSEVYFFWIPPAVATVYLWALLQARQPLHHRLAANP